MQAYFFCAWVGNLNPEREWRTPPLATKKILYREVIAEYMI